MSVLIKGIDMPKEPWDCPCHNGETGQCKVINIGCYDYIPKYCPLVSVPTPHGRLADCDAVRECLEEIMSGDEQYALTLLDWAVSKRTIVEAEE